MGQLASLQRGMMTGKHGKMMKMKGKHGGAVQVVSSS
jgi:hypothetical protein